MAASDEKKWAKDGEPVYPLKGNEDDSNVECTDAYLPRWARWPFFYFPYATNDWSARFVGMQVCICSIILAIAGLTQQAPLTVAWLTAIMFAGFVIRFVWGGQYSLFGAIGNIFARRLETNAILGAPKQFAAFCGIMFTFGAMIANFYGPFYSGPIILFALAGAAGLEGFVGFCVGCVFFELIVEPLGLTSDKTRIMGRDVVEDMRQGLEEQFANKKWNEGEPKTYEGVIPATTSVGRNIYFKYSDKTNHYREDDVHFIRHCKLAYCLPGLGWAAVAAIFKELFLKGIVPVQWPWTTMTIVGFVLFCIWAILYVAKLVFYPKRVLKDVEGKHSRYFSAGIPISFILFGFLAQREQDDIARALFWLGSMSNIFLTLWLITRKIIHPISPGEITPAITIPLLGNILAGVTLQQWIDWDGIQDLAIFLWAPSTLLWGLLAPGILLRTFDAPTMQPGLRVTMMTYMAAPGLAASAYFTTYSVTQSPAPSLDIVFLSLFFLAVLAELLIVMLFLANYYKPKFNENYWFSVFCVASVTFPVIIFDRIRETEFTYVWVMVQVTVLTGLALIFTAHTLQGVVNGKWFRQFPKNAGVGPMDAVSRLTHDACRTAGAKMVKLAQRLPNLNGERRSRAIADLTELLDGYLTTLDLHSHYEDDLVFPIVDAYLPKRRKVAEMQHVQLHKLEVQMVTLLNLLKGRKGDVTQTTEQKEVSEEVAKAVTEGQDGVVAMELQETKKTEEPKDMKALLSVMQTFIKANNDHMQHEEDHISPVLRKLLNARQLRSVARKCLKSGTPEKWRKMLPFVITHQDYHPRRVRYLMSLRVVYPERMQLYGQYLYNGISFTLFERLRVDIPELAPRGTEGHWRLW